MTDWNEVYTELKRLFPDLEAGTTKGRVIRACLNDAAAKIIIMRHGAEGERLATEYVNAVRENPLEGLRAFPKIAEEVLGIIQAYNIHLKKTPTIGLREFKKWFLDHKVTA
ncbi:MAG: hypothetical protein ABSG71_06090 [Thermodesulfobacteriota bacterium]|jgi:hypothetical protein